MALLLLLLPQATLDEEIDERDWGMQQVLTSANWGGVIGNFFTGGLNLQVRPHLPEHILSSAG
jgi:fatty acid desaturase (delta-4 desaturase)